MGGNFKFQVQDSFLEYFFWRFEDLKNESHFLKKATFSLKSTLNCSNEDRAKHFFKKQMGFSKLVYQLPTLVLVH